jgi:hypothetical protein
MFDARQLAVLVAQWDHRGDGCRDDLLTWLLATCWPSKTSQDQ